MHKKSARTKSGAASIFVVIFTTLLLSIITLSFVRIMLSEAKQTTDYDLSQSAYDSALAGIEDAKIALLKYHECLSKGASASSGTQECQKAIKAMTAENATDNCDIVSDMITRPNNNEETIVQSEKRNDVTEGGEVMNQAYTCVKINEATEDYLGTLNQNYQSKMIPIRTGQNANIDSILLQWYNSVDSNKLIARNYITSLSSRSFTTNKENYGSSNFKPGRFAATPLAPPVIRLKYMQSSPNGFTLASLNQNSGNTTNQGTLLFRPSTNGVTEIGNSSSIGLAASADKSLNNPVDVNCANSEFRCSVKIKLPEAVGGSRDDATSFIYLSLPYNQPETTFSVKLLDASGKAIPFLGVQSKIDSTGRANDLFRRLEARVEMVDVYYPFPEYGVNISGTGDDSIWKNFYVTTNCWTSNGSCNNYGNLGGNP